MVKVDLNRISIVGLLLGGVAVALFVLEALSDRPLSVGAILGPDAPLANIHLWMAFAVAGGAVYLLGRIVFLTKNRFGMPPTHTRRDDD